MRVRQLRAIAAQFGQARGGRLCGLRTGQPAIARHDERTAMPGCCSATTASTALRLVPIHADRGVGGDAASSLTG